MADKSVCRGCFYFVKETLWCFKKDEDLGRFGEMTQCEYRNNKPNDKEYKKETEYEQGKREAWGLMCDWCVPDIDSDNTAFEICNRKCTYETCPLMAVKE